MSIIEREIESNSGGLLMLVEIVYECDITEDGRVLIQIDLEEANVLAVTGYDKDGKVVYDYEHRNLSKERLEHLDEVAFSIIENDVIDGGSIYEDLWDKA